MTIVLIVVGILFLAGIFLVSGTVVVKQRGRENFLEALAVFMESKVKAIEGREHDFRVDFRFEGGDYTFDDVEETGFSGKLNKAYLKAKINNNFVLSFTEKEIRRTITTEIFKASDIEEGKTTKEVKVEIPKVLQNFNVHTNNPKLTSYFLNDPKVVGIFASFKNLDARGYSSMALKILNKEVMLEFNTLPGYHPNLSLLRTNVSSIEEYLDQLAVLVKFINNFPQS